MNRAVSAVLLGVLVLAGCGAAPPATPAAPEPTGAFPVTVPGAFGDATIPQRPVRVVAMSWTDADIALGLGVVPVGMARVRTAETGIEPWAQPLLGPNPPTLFDTDKGDPIEAVAALRPDLILATKDYHLGDSHAQLSTIAPVVSYVTAPNADAWEDTTARIGTALGRVDEARRGIDDTHAALAATRDGHPAFAGHTFTLFVQPTPDGVYVVNSTEDTSAKLLAQLGLTPAPGATRLPTSSIPGRARIGYEQLFDVGADVLLSTGSASGQAALAANPVFATLPAARAGAHVPLDPPTAQAFAFPSPISIRWGLDVLVPKLAGVLRQ